MKKNLIFIIFFSTILFFIATFGILSTVFAQTSTNVCRYNIETKEDPICISRTACRMVVDDCQGEWGCITPFGCSAPKPTCANTENCSKWSPVNEQRSSTSLDRERAEELENILKNMEKVPYPPFPYPECISATSTPMPMYCFFSYAVHQQELLWMEIEESINAYNSALYMYKLAVESWKNNVKEDRPSPRPIPPDPNDFIVKENNSLSDILFKRDRDSVRYESSYGSDPRALTPPVSKDEAFRIFNDEYQRLFREIANHPESYSYGERPPTGQRPPQQHNPPTGQRPPQQHNPPTGQRPPQQYNPFDVSYFGPTTIPGVTDRNQSNQTQQNQSQSQNKNVSNTNNAINSLSDIMSKINSVLEGVNNLSKEEKDVITKAIQSILDIIKDLIVNLTKRTIETQQAQNQNQSQSQSQIPETLPTQKVSTSTSGVKISVTTKPATTTFRYIKDDISKSGWVAIREMKFYDVNNNEIKPVNANASCDWCGYGTPPSYSVGPKGVFDGNWETVWNAGETASDCSWYTSHIRDDGIYGVGCTPSKIRTAWINVDLGNPISLSKIKIHIMGDSDNRLDSLSGSTDGKNYVDLCKIQASKDMPLVDLGPTGDWIECNLEK